MCQNYDVFAHMQHHDTPCDESVHSRCLVLCFLLHIYHRSDSITLAQAIDYHKELDPYTLIFNLSADVKA